MPIQMIGTRRSGSNLLRVMIGQLPGVFAPQSTHMLEYFKPLIPYYGDLNKDEVFAQLVDDMCRCVELNPVVWTGVELERQTIIRRCKQRSLLAIFAAIYSEAAEQRDCRYDWMCKCLGYINYFDDLENHFGGQLKYIYVYRDGRDVALSFTKALAGHKHHYFIAQEWARTQRLALQIQRRLPETRFHSVCYEKLLSDPQGTCESLANFIGVPYTDDMLRYYDSHCAKSSASTSELWGNISKPILSDNKRKFLTQSSETQIRVFEAVAGDELRQLGYETLYYPPATPPVFNERQIAEFTQLDKDLKRQVVHNANAEDVQRKERQKAFVDSVKQRLACTEVIYHGNMLHKEDLALEPAV